MRLGNAFVTAAAAFIACATAALAGGGEHKPMPSPRFNVPHVSVPGPIVVAGGDRNCPVPVSHKPMPTPNIPVPIPHIKIPPHGGGGCKNCGGRTVIHNKTINNTTVVSVDRSENNVFVRGGSTYITYVNRVPVPIGELNVECVESETEATLVRAVRAYCVDARGEQHPASRTFGDTWLDAGYEGEIFRCLEGTHMEAVVGHVVDSQDGMAAVYEGGDELICEPGEALVHLKGGQVRCRKAKTTPECTERQLLRRYGAGDVFFSYRHVVQACIPGGGSQGVSLTGMYLDGGVGGYGGY